MNPDNPIWTAFDLESNLIKEYKYWMLLVRKNNAKIGSCVAILKRDAFPLGEVTSEEMAEYAIVAKEIEAAIKKSFNTYLVHHMALMFKDKHVHFHIIPRYKEAIEFAGITWEDDNIADPLVQKREELSREILNEIKEKLKSTID